MLLLVFTASFACVFLLGLNSRVMRDERVAAAATISWFITVAQFVMTWAVLHAELTPAEYILSGGLGGSLGITSSHYFYVWAAKLGCLGGNK
tara:strand:+ start:2618 stop:2893 length:276 start_codon:yes stop_codon:yes gene_type:complete